MSDQGGAHDPEAADHSSPLTNRQKPDSTNYTTSRSQQLAVPTGKRPLTQRNPEKDKIETSPGTELASVQNPAHQAPSSAPKSLQHYEGLDTVMAGRQPANPNTNTETVAIQIGPGSGDENGGNIGANHQPTRTISGRVLRRTTSKIESFLDPNSPISSRVHRCPVKTLESQLKANLVTGLNSKSCETDKNKITVKSENVVFKIAKYVFGGFNLIMWIALVLSVLSYQPLGGKDPQIVSLGVAVVLLVTIIVCSAFYARVDFAANKMMSAMKSLVAANCMVIRDGIEQQILATDVNVGDILLLSLGQRVAGDARLIECSSDLAFDRSLLTGESEPVHGSTTCTDKNMLETKNIALASSFVLRGTAKAMVFAIGDDTVIGHIMRLASGTKPKLSPLQKEIQKFTIAVTILAFTSFSIAILLWGVWQRTSYPGFNTAGSAIINAIGCLCALVPEGLPIAFALSLSIIAGKMADANVLVKNLSTIETLGCMTFLASDKTNTLTTSQMTVQRCITFDQNLSFSTAPSEPPTDSRASLTSPNPKDVPAPAALNVHASPGSDTPAVSSLSPDLQTKLIGMKPRSSHASSVMGARASSFHSASSEGSRSPSAHFSRMSHHAPSSTSNDLQEAIKAALIDKPLPTVHAIHRISSLCCGASFLPQTDAVAIETTPICDRPVNGDPTDTAILRFSHIAKPYLGVVADHHEYQEQYTTLFSLPFNSNNKFMATVVIETHNPHAKPILLFKGGADVVMRNCDQILASVPPHLQHLHNAHDHTAEADLTPSQIIHNGTRSIPMDAPILAQITEQKNSAAAQGYRVLALAQIELNLPSMGDLSPIQEIDDIDENNESDDDEYNLIEKSRHEQALPSSQPTSPEPAPPAPATIQVPAPAQPIARYLYPDNWESFCLQQIAAHHGTLVGCVCIMDPPRADVPDTVRTLSRAGVTVAMVTGDFQLTAESIARQVNIITAPTNNTHTIKDVAKLQLNWEAIHNYPEDWYDMKPEPEIDPMNRRAIVLNGVDVATLSEHDWHFVCSFFHEFVFARTTPEHKQMIVEAFKARGRVVAVTGDGVNDVAALKSADVGVAMAAGADLAKDAASIVLVRNSFSSLVIGLIYGRLVFANLRKILMFLMSTGAFVEFLAVVVNVLFGTPLPLVAFFQIIFCCTSDIAISLALMFEGPEGDILEAKPRDVRKDHLVDWRWLVRCLFQFTLVTFIGSIGMWFLTMHDHGIGFLDIVFAFNKWTPGFHGFDKDQLNKIATSASAAYYISMIWCNIGNCLAIRTSMTSITQSNPLWGPDKNLKLPLCFFISLCFAVFFVFCPGLPKLVDTHTVKAKYWFIPMTFPIGIVLFDEFRKYLVRNVHWAKKLAKKENVKI